MDRWQYELGHVEGCKGIISSSSGQIRHLQPYCGGTSICLVGPILDKEEKSHPGKKEVQILAQITQVRD